MKSVGRPLTFMALLVVLGFLTSGFLLFYSTGNKAQKLLIIPRGSSIRTVTDLLYKEGVVPFRTPFKVLLRVTHGSTKVRAGEFVFYEGMNLVSALNTLYYSEPVTHPITIPEGWNVKQIADILRTAQLGDADKFLALAQSAEEAKKFHINSSTLEGFLFPDTYAFSKVDTEDKMLETMVHNFRSKFQNDYEKEIRALGWTVERLVTLASIVEKETGVKEEQPIVASVFYNRLKKHMRLESDPTTIYGIPNYSGKLTTADLHRYTPYNTRVIKELPPTPIANPGLGALVATLRPANTPYLYFVANKEGPGHVFSTNYGDHTRHVQQYVKKPKRRLTKTQ